MGSANQKLTLILITLAVLATTAFYWPKSDKSSIQPNSDSSQIISLWDEPELIPGGRLPVGPEVDRTKGTDDLIAGQRIIRLGDVGEPELHVFLPLAEKRNDTAVLICPGGGFTILAWDLEGTEVATWFNSIGVTACVLKYRVPTRSHDDPGLIPLQDTQRAISLIRHNAERFQIDTDKVGVLGFSAGGAGAARVGTAKRMYPSMDEVDELACNANFTILIYAGQIADESGQKLAADLEINQSSPPVFMVHAFDDFVPVENCLVLSEAHKKAGVPIELHLFDSGGHGFGIRNISGVPVTYWTDHCQAWLMRNGWIANGNGGETEGPARNSNQ